MKRWQLFVLLVLAYTLGVVTGNLIATGTI
jgi:hypothetical protein